MTRKKNIAVLILKIAVSLALLTVFLYKVDFVKVGEAISQIPAIFILSAIGVNVIANLVSALKWKLLLPGHSFTRILLLAMVGRFYSLILPGQIAGEGIKAYMLGKGRTDAEKVAASVILDKITGILSIFMVGITGILFSSVAIPATIIIALTAGIFILVFLLAGLQNRQFISFVNRVFAYLAKRIKFFEKPLNSTMLMMDELKLFVKNPILIIINIFTGYVYQLFAIILILVLSRSFGITIDFFDYCWIFGIISIALILPVTIAGLGIREGTFIGLLGWMGIAGEKATALSFAFFGMQLLDAIIGGIINFTGIYKVNPK